MSDYRTEKPLKIGLVSHEYPPFRGGGIGTYVTLIAERHARVGHEVHVITNMFDYGSTDPDHRKPVSVREFESGGRLYAHRVEAINDDWSAMAPHDTDGTIPGQLYGRWSQYLYYAERVADRLEEVHAEYGLDVAEFPECAAEGYAAIRRKRLGLAMTDLPMTVCLHSPIYEIYQYNLYSRFNKGFQFRTALEEYTIRHADAICSPSWLLTEIVKDRLDLRDDGRAWDVLPLPMDFESLPPTESGAPAWDADAPPKLFFVGRLEPRKGVRYLVDAAVQVMEDHPELTVELVGKDCDAGEAPGMMTDYLRSRIPAKFQDNFSFPGLQPRESLFERYRTATACVFAPKWDNFPNTCMEAMASGGFVIASHYTGMAEMIEDGKSGLLFQAGDTDALAKQIRRAVEDHDLQRSVRAEAPPRIRSMCDPDRAVRIREDHFGRVNEAHRSRIRAAASSEPRRFETVEVFMPAEGTAAEQEATKSNVLASAEKAGLRARVSVVEAPGGPGSDIRAWLREEPVAGADLLMRLHPGETVEPDYLPRVVDALQRCPDAAWATSWMMATEDSGGQVYAGLDFDIPLDIICHQPVPFAVVVGEAFRAVGGLNTGLPAGWRDWDFWLALRNAGHEGVVVPLWLATYDPDAPGQRVHPGTAQQLEVMLDEVVARSRPVFRERGEELWMYRTMNSVSSQIAEAGGADAVRDWGGWWQLTKANLKRQWPSVAQAYRRHVKAPLDRFAKSGSR